MSPAMDVMAGTVTCFPRVSGDEPTVEGVLHGPAVLSPRERG